MGWANKFKKQILNRGKKINMKLNFKKITLSLAGFVVIFASHAKTLNIEKITSNEGQVISAEARYGLDQTDVCLSGYAKKFINYSASGPAHVDVTLLEGKQTAVTKTTPLYSSLLKPIALRSKRLAYKVCFASDEISQASKVQVTYHAHPHSRCNYETVIK